MFFWNTVYKHDYHDDDHDYSNSTTTTTTISMFVVIQLFQFLFLQSKNDEERSCTEGCCSYHAVGADTG